MLRAGSSVSLAGASSRTEKRESEAGEELCTTMAGVDWPSGFLIWERRELVRERERRSSPGGGDLRRGEMGQWGVLSPELELVVPLTGRGALIESAGAVGGSSGMLVADRARWMAAAEGVLVLKAARLAALLGLTSVLLLRERKPGLPFVPAGAALRW